MIDSSDGQSFKDKQNNWLQMFLRGVRERTIETHVREDEGYKFESVDNFQKYFNIDAPDLAGNIDISILNTNLVTGAMFYPRKMLLVYAREYVEETRDILRTLFDETKDVYSRINETKSAFESLEQRRASDRNMPADNTFITLRFISLLLGFRYPDKYNALKPNEWKVYARYIDPGFSMPHKKTAGEQYKIYCEYIDPLREFLRTRPEIRDLKNRLTEGLSFSDDEYRWITQDVIYVTARYFAIISSVREDPAILPTTDAVEATEALSDPIDDFNTGFMALEKHLEEYVIRNWDRIDFGENLRLYSDQDGTTGQQYTTDVGILDILAVDDNGDFVVIELKRAESGFEVVGQILNYMGWIKEKLAVDGQNVRGVIIVGKANAKLQSAVKPVGSMIKIKEYSVSMQLHNV